MAKTTKMRVPEPMLHEGTRYHSPKVKIEVPLVLAKRIKDLAKKQETARLEASERNARQRGNPLDLLALQLATVLRKINDLSEEDQEQVSAAAKEMLPEGFFDPSYLDAGDDEGTANTNEPKLPQPPMPQTDKAPAADQTALPDDFPHRATVVKAGYGTVEALKGLEDFTTIDGIGEEYAKAIRKALKAL